MDAHLNVHHAMVQEKKDKDKMINFNSLWRNVAEHGFPEAGKPESLIGKQCRYVSKEDKIIDPVLILKVRPIENSKYGYVVECYHSLYEAPATFYLSSIEYLNDSEEAFRDMVKPVYMTGWEDSREAHDPYVSEWYDSFRGFNNNEKEEWFYESLTSHPNGNTEEQKTK